MFYGDVEYEYKWIIKIFFQHQKINTYNLN